GWFFSRPTRRNCNRRRRYGRLSTSPSSTSTSKRSTNSTPSSASDARHSPANRRSSKAEPASIGGQKSASRSDQPETVSPFETPASQALQGEVETGDAAR